MKLTGDWSETGEIIPWVEVWPEMLPRRWNIAPTDPVVVVTESPEAVLMRWGLVRWAKALKGRPLINARAETVATQSAFKSSFSERRCLIPADGFYEWRTEDGNKQPYLFTGPDKVMALAGIHANWQSPEGEAINSCAVITTAAQGLIETYHDRMPAILPPHLFSEWLAGDTPQERLLEILQNPVNNLSATRVSRRLNNVKNDDPACCEPEAPPRPEAF